MDVSYMIDPSVNYNGLVEKFMHAYVCFDLKYCKMIIV